MKLGTKITEQNPNPILKSQNLSILTGFKGVRKVSMAGFDGFQWISIGFNGFRFQCLSKLLGFI